MKNMLMRTSIIVIAAAVTAWGQAKPAAGPVTFKDGDTIVFLGDNITHHPEKLESYCQYIENYYFTRYPQMRLHFMNAGVSGSKMSHAWQRFDQAVARCKPKYVAIMLGMNDAGYVDFDQARFHEYTKEYRHLLDQIAFIKATAIPMMPTLLDYRNTAVNLERSEQDKRILLGNTCTLAYYGAWVREEALARGLPLVDPAAGMVKVLWDVRRSYPEYMLALDGINPTPAGLFVIAHSFIEAMETNRCLSRVELLVTSGKVLASWEGGKLAEAAGNSGGVRFVFQASGLPWALPPEPDPQSKECATFAYRRLDSGRALGREIVRVIGLAPNMYDLKIDGQSVGRFDNTLFSQGIELQDNPKTPQYQQGQAVAALNAEKTRGPMFQLGKEYERVRDSGGAADTETIDRFELQIKDYEKQIYAANQPKPHRYEIVPFARPAK